MKFGKKIASVSASSKALCPPEDWMNYKHLKQLLKDIQNNDPLAAQRSANNHAASTPEKAKRAGSPANGSAVVAKDSDKPLTSSRDSSNLNGKPIVAKKRAGSIVESKYEKIFFSQLKQELQKVTDSFGKLEQRLFARFREFLPKMNRLKQAFEDKHVLVKSEEVSKVVEECAELHFLLVCLESYAVINYAGFTKILKKHDKVTGFTTRDKYMLKLVDEKSFAQHKRIKGVLNAVTLEFGKLKTMLLNNKTGTHVYPAAYEMQPPADKGPSSFKRVLLTDARLKALKTDIPPPKKRRVS